MGSHRARGSLPYNTDRFANTANALQDPDQDSMPLDETLNRADSATELSPSGPYRALKQAGLVLLCTAWIVLGLIGHDPWKPDDATSFGIAYDMLTHGDWIVPQVAGTPAPERPPLVDAVSAATARMFVSVLPLHDGARVA